MNARGWRALLDGADAQAALEVVDEIAGAVSALMLADDAAGDLAGGSAGAAILLGALERAGRSGPKLASSRQLLNHAVHCARRDRMPAGLWLGRAGVAFALHHVAGRPPKPGLARWLCDWVERGAGGEYDLMSGAVGIGALALELGPGAPGDELLGAVAAHLAQTLEHRDGALTWASPRPAGPGLGVYNLGVAQGVPGIIGVLAGALASGRAVHGARGLLEGAARWTLAQRLTDADSCLPYAVGAARDDEPSRLAWCYGDAGAAVTLLLAARALADDDIDRAARELAARAASRRADTAGVNDTGFCHGSAGLAHLFGRLWQLTDDDRCAAAGRYWLQRTLDMRRPALPVAGFPALVHPDGEAGQPEPRPVAGMLTGAAGVALVLLAACSAKDPSWDRAMLASHP